MKRRWISMWTRYLPGRWLGRGLLTVLCCMVLLQLLAPMVAGPLLRQALGERLGRQVCVASVHINPWLLQAEVNEVLVLAAGAAAHDCAQHPSQTALHLGHGQVRLDWRSLWMPGWRLAQWHMDRLDVHIVQQAQGRLDIADILDKLERERDASQDHASSRPTVVVRDAQLTRSSLHWMDGATGQAQVLRDVEIRLPYASTLPQDSQMALTPSLSFRLNGALMQVQARAWPFQVPMTAELAAQGTALELKPVWSVIEPWVGVTVTDGRVSFESNFRYQAQSEKGAGPVLALDGKLQLSGLRLNWADRSAGVPAGHLELDGLALALEAADGFAHTVKIQHVRVDRPVLTWPLGQENVPILAPKNSSKTIAKNSYINSDKFINNDGKSPQKPWRIQIANLAVNEPVWRAKVGGLDPAAPQANEWRVVGAVQAALSGEVLNDGIWALTLNQLQWPQTRWQPWPIRPGPPAPTTYLAFDGLNIQHLHIENEHHTAVLQGAALTGLSGAMQRGRDGRLGLSRAVDGVWWLTTSDHPQPDAARTPGLHRWQLRFNAIDLGVKAWRWMDEMPDKPVALLVSDLALNMGPGSWPVGSPVPVSMRANVVPVSALEVRPSGSRRPTGQVSLAGRVQWDKPAFAGEWAVSGLALEPLASYGMDGFNAQLEQGWLSAKGDVNASVSAVGAAPRVLVHADVSLDDFALRQGSGKRTGGAVALAAGKGKAYLAPPDTVTDVNRGLDAGDPLVNWRQAQLRGVRVELVPGQPPAIDVRNTVLRDFFARIALDTQGHLNLSQLRRTPITAPPAAAIPPGVPTIRLGPVRLENGRVQFSDQFIQPNYAADMSALTGVWEGMAPTTSAPPSGSTTPAMPQLTLQGRIEGTGDLSIHGQLNPLVSPPLLDLQGQASDVELKPLTPYSIKYAGHGIEGGTLSASVGYRLDAAGHLAASHRLVLNQLRFGEAVEGAPSSLPVRLAVALLADRHGVIDLEVPVTGSLKDPEFSLLPVVFKAVGNLIARAVTAPFALLGNALGSSLDTRTNDISFLAGTDALPNAAAGPLASLGEALKDRPGAGVEISTWVDPIGERAAAAAVLLARTPPDAGRDSPLPVNDPDPAAAERTPISLDPSWVLDLARRRAVAVRLALEAHGVSPSQIVLKPDVVVPQPAPAVPAAPGAVVPGARLQLVAR